MRPVVFIHTSDQQLLPATLCAYSLQARARERDAFEIRMLRLEETPHLYSRREGLPYRSNDYVCTWRDADLLAFMPLRMMVPQVMGFRGRALLLDPDVFALADVCELLHRDMEGKAILCRKRRNGPEAARTEMWSTAVMLLDCARLEHWRWNDEIDAVFALRLDLEQWMHLSEERPETIGPLEDEWNDLDRLDEHTRILHASLPDTQPWRTGLPVNFGLNAVGAHPYRPGCQTADLAHSMVGQASTASSGEVFRPHPNPLIERFFFALLKEAIEHGAVTHEFVEAEIQKRHVRADALEILNRIDS